MGVDDRSGPKKPEKNPRRAHSCFTCARLHNEGAWKAVCMISASFNPVTSASLILFEARPDSPIRLIKHRHGRNHNNPSREARAGLARRIFGLPFVRIVVLGFMLLMRLGLNTDAMASGPDYLTGGSSGVDPSLLWSISPRLESSRWSWRRSEERSSLRSGSAVPMTGCLKRRSPEGEGSRFVTLDPRSEP